MIYGFYYYFERCSFGCHFYMKVEYPFLIQVLVIFQEYFGMRVAVANFVTYMSYYWLNSIQECLFCLFFLIFYQKSIFRIDSRLEAIDVENYILFSSSQFQFALYRKRLINDSLSSELQPLEQNSSHLKLWLSRRFHLLGFYQLLLYDQMQMKETMVGVKVFVWEEIQRLLLKVMDQLFLVSYFDQV